MIIYRATNQINGKVYIGQTVKSLNYRKNQHFRIAKLKNHKNYFHNSLLKNKDIFFWDIIDEAKTIEELNEKEKFWIKYFNSTDKDFGYNFKSGGKNGILNNEARKKISVANKNKIPWIKGKKHTKKSKLKMSKAHKGRKLSEEHKRKISKSEKGRIFPDDVKLKIKNSKKKCIGTIGHKTYVDENKVKQIKILLKSGYSDEFIMKRFNIKYTTYHNIKYNTTWKHVKI